MKHVCVTTSTLSSLKQRRQSFGGFGGRLIRLRLSGCHRTPVEFTEVKRGCRGRAGKLLQHHSGRSKCVSCWKEGHIFYNALPKCQASLTFSSQDETAGQERAVSLSQRQHPSRPSEGLEWGHGTPLLVGAALLESPRCSCLPYIDIHRHSPVSAAYRWQGTRRSRTAPLRHSERTLLRGSRSRDYNRGRHGSYRRTPTGPT